MSALQHPAANWPLRILAALAVIYTLKVARDVMLPITLAAIFALLLGPAVTRMQQWHIPRGLAAVLLLALSLGIFAGGLYMLTQPATDWLARAPEAVDIIREQLRSVDQGNNEVDAASRSLDSLAQALSSEPSDPGTTEVVVTDPGWRQELWTTVRNFGVYGTLSIIMLLFLLTSGGALLSRVVHVLPSQRDKATVVEMARHAQAQMSRYLTTITAVNAALGVVTGLALWAMGFPDPALWGALAAVMRYIPYLGVSIMVMLLALISVVTFDSAAMMLAAPLGFIVLTSLVGQFVDPVVHGLRFRLNPIVVFLWIFFWGWMWGAPGVLLAVPLLTLVQVVCRNVEQLSPIAHIIGSE